MLKREKGFASNCVMSKETEISLDIRNDEIIFTCVTYIDCEHLFDTDGG